ncbi:MAG: hypothetical protein JNL70_00255 [Saprospiraceae bacterium]|nr:hypothetical protein [Saprospiraceae bacterium]
MPLVKATIKAQIKAAFIAEQTATDDPEKSLERISDKLADIVIAAIKSQTITIVGNAGANPLTVISITIT